MIEIQSEYCSGAAVMDVTLFVRRWLEADGRERQLVGVSKGTGACDVDVVLVVES